MRRLIIFATLVLLCATVQLIISCSSPLKSSDGGDLSLPGPGGGRDTLFLSDTIFSIDTVFNGDTIFTIDTVFAGDTIFAIDTVFAGDTIFAIDTVFAGDTIFTIDTVLNGDTIFAIDTVFNGDTIFAIDTVFNGDTIITVDTVILVDTVEVFPPDSLNSPVVCARISSGHREIVWLFRNEMKSFKLEFVAALERDKPPHSLQIDINGELYEWDLTAGLEMVLDLVLEENSVIKIGISKPPSYGHAIDICLTLTEL